MAQASTHYHWWWEDEESVIRFNPQVLGFFRWNGDYFLWGTDRFGWR